MADSDRRCGTCRWFGADNYLGDGCNFQFNGPVPLWADAAARWVDADDEDCPTWEAKPDA